MTAPPFDLRRPTRRPAVGLFRTTVVVTALTLPLVWLFTAWRPFGPPRCRGIVPCIHSIPEYGAVFRAVVATGCVELAAIAIYLVLARPTAALRYVPVAVGVVALALGAWVPAISGSGALWLVPLYLLWIAAPVILHGVHRADPRSVIPVLLALLPSCAVGAILTLETLWAALPALILVASAAFVVVRRLR
ncbi:hypothetical protein [Kribbella sp. NPDC050470]|uniref:hypothetical protein n=1 Tax=unclassified Kribbella TaxID=2644121 RepID=UPI0037B92027